MQIIIFLDHPITGKVYVLVFHQGIFCCQIDNHLICPMQCRVNGVVINNMPKMCVPNPDYSTHSIKVTDPLDQDATLHIPLILKGVTSCFCVRRPTTVEFEDEDIPKLDMTSESPEWDPGDPDWAIQEASTMDSRGRVHDLDNVIAGGCRFMNLVSTSSQSANFTSDEYFHVALQALVNVSRVKVGHSQRAIGHELLAGKWIVSEVVCHTLERTTQRGVRTISHPVFEQMIGNSAISGFGTTYSLTQCSQSISRTKGSSTRRSIRPDSIGAERIQ